MVELVNKKGAWQKRRQSALAKSGDGFPRYEITAANGSGQEKNFLTLGVAHSFRGHDFFRTPRFDFG